VPHPLTTEPARPATDATHLAQTSPSSSAEIVCAMRAVDNLLPEGTTVAGDRFAHHFVQHRSYRARFATAGLARLTAKVFDWRYPSYMGIVLLRQRYWDAALVGALADGVDQVVVLGAGYDTTALRHELGGATVFEVDAPPTQERKRDRMEQAGLRSSGRVAWVPCDFERDHLGDRLLEQGFDPRRRSVTVWYGVTFFITEPAVRSTLEELASLSAPGSLLVWDYIYPSVHDGSTPHLGARRARAAVIKRHEPYRFGADRAAAEALVAAAGYQVVDHAPLPEVARRFGAPEGVWCRADDIVGVMTAQHAGRR
jgi:methyltransferase (TIGR00027 family)